MGLRKKASEEEARGVEFGLRALWFGRRRASATARLMLIGRARGARLRALWRGPLTPLKSGGG